MYSPPSMSNKNKSFVCFISLIDWHNLDEHPKSKAYYVRTTKKTPIETRRKKKIDAQVGEKQRIHATLLA